jgi:hypothetical protein
VMRTLDDEQIAKFQAPTHYVENAGARARA